LKLNRKAMRFVLKGPLFDPALVEAATDNAARFSGDFIHEDPSIVDDRLQLPCEIV
jgi:hypothetical protein